MVSNVLADVAEVRRIIIQEGQIVLSVTVVLVCLNIHDNVEEVFNCNRVVGGRF